jgi:hypothetical protein
MNMREHAQAHNNKYVCIYFINKLRVKIKFTIKRDINVLQIDCRGDRVLMLIIVFDKK